jgi:hypothetical protein
MKNRMVGGALAAVVALCCTTSASARGDDGHKLVAWIAYRLLTPAAKAKVDAMLQADTDTHLTDADFAARATWADKYRDEANCTLHYTATKNWHFVDLEISGADLAGVCNPFPKLPAGAPASQGAANDCAYDKINQFKTELANPATDPAERLMALKFVMHFVGDIHQPLHASDDHNSGGNCEQVRLADGSRKFALHHYWDTETVDALLRADSAATPADQAPHAVSNATIQSVGGKWLTQIKAADRTALAKGDTKAWVMESYGVAKSVAYKLPPHDACKPGDTPTTYAAFTLPLDYQKTANTTTKRQIQTAGVRLAAVLNEVLK